MKSGADFVLMWLGARTRGEFSATWMLLSDHADFFAQPEIAARAKPPALKPGLRLWTDDYSSLLPLLRW